MAGDFERSDINSVFGGDDDDDCVIFKGSPLYESLLQSGYEMSGNEVESSVNSDLLQDSKKTERQDSVNKDVLTTQTSFVRLKSQLMHLYRLVVGLFTRQLDTKHQVKQNNSLILDKLKKCSSLDEDDADFIEWFVDTPHMGDIKKRSRISKWLYAIVTPVVLSYGYTRMFHTVPLGKEVWCTDMVAVLCSGYLSIQTVLHLVNVIRHRKYRQEGISVDCLLGGSEMFLTALRKSLRLIQETELISRGFTLVSQKNPLSRLEDGKRQTVRQCPALRKLLFTCSCDSIHLLRGKTKHLLQLLPHNPEIDVTSGYLAFEPIENYGPCLQMTASDSVVDGHIYNLTDGFSVSALKGISQLLTLHLSEFIKGLTIFYHQDCRKTDLNHVPVLTIIHDLSANISSWTDSLQRSMDFHNSSLVRKDRELTQSREKTEYGDLYIAVHSLDLHLQSAITRVRSLSSEIESHDHTKDQSDLSRLSHDQINERMQPIRAELASCDNCFSEALSRLDQLMGKSRADEEERQTVTMPSHLDKEKGQGNIKEIEDYIIVDQVFEAYTDPDEIGMVDGDWGKPLTAEEKEKKRKDKEEALRMMSELKSVIKVRAKDTEKRETAALIRSQTGAKETEDNKTLSDKMSTLNKTELHKGNDKALSDEISTNNVTISNEKDENISPAVKEEDVTAKEIVKAKLRVEITDKSICEEENTEVHDISDQQSLRLDEFRTKSVVTQQGVRRLRKGNMLDDSDSEDEQVDDNFVRIMSKTPGEAQTNFPTHFSFKVKNDKPILQDGSSLPLRDHADNVEEGILVNKDEGLHKDISNNCARNLDEDKSKDLLIGKTSGDDDDDDDDDDDGNELSNPSLTGLSLEERLARHSGLDFCLTSSIASMAAARSRAFVQQEETFGEEEEYGELSENDSDADG